MGILGNYLKDYGGCSTPCYEIKIKGKKFKSDSIRLTEILVSLSVGFKASMCMLTFFKYGTEVKRKKVGIDSDFSNIKLGEKIEVSLGYKVGKKLSTKPVFVGFISKYDIKIDNNGNTRALVECMDAKMWMMTGSKTEEKTNCKKYSAAVSDVCNKSLSILSGKEVKISGEKSLTTPIYQYEESDYEFLCRLADKSGALFFIQNGKLIFKTPSASRSSKLTISPGGNFVKSIKVSGDICGIPKSVEVVNVDEKNYKKSIKGKATSSDTIGSGKKASSLTKNIGSNNVIKIVDTNISSADQAKSEAQAIFNRYELGLSSTQVEIAGMPDIKLLDGVKIKDLDDPFDNEYIVSGIEHHVSNKNVKYAYTTTLTLTANRYSPKSKSIF